MQVRDQNGWTIITTSEAAGSRGGPRAGVAGPAARAAGARPAGEVIALAGSTHRRGSVLVLVIGVLALLAIIVVVYTAIGQADTRTARALTNKVVVTDTSKAVADHIAQVVANNGVSGFFQQDVASQQVRYSLQNWDYPSTDPEVRSVASSAGAGAPPAITNADEARSRLFDPTGTQRHRWFENGRVDPRESGDPWLASTEPVWLNQNGSTLNNPSDLVLRMQDWLHMSIIAPDGRAVNLANLRGNLLAGSGLGQINGAAGMTSRMLRVTPANTPGGVPTFDLWRDSDVEVNTPSTWSSRGLGMFRQVRDTNGLASDQLSPGSPLNLNNSFADADGDGFYDSFWQELVDASDPRQPVNLLGSAAGSGGLRVFVAPRIIDLSGLVNVNTATSFSDPFASRQGTVPQGAGGEVLDPTLPYFNPTGSAANYERAWRAAPVRTRTTFITAGSVTDRDTMATRANFIEAPAGLSPADVDLERLLTMLDTTRYLDRQQGFFGSVAGGYAPADGPSVNDAFVQTGSPTALRAELGGAAFSSLMFTRGTGATTVQDLLFAAAPTGLTSLDGLSVYPQFVPGQTAFATSESQRGVFRWAYGGGVALPPPFTATPAEVEAYNLQNALGTYRLFVTPMDRADLYRKLGAAEGVRFDREETPAFGGGGPFGGTGELGFSSVSRIGLTSERELRAFNGVNDPSIKSALELVLDSRLDTTGRGPLRSDRSLLEDRDLGVGTPAAVAARMTQYFAEPRRNLTTISGARPITSFSVPFFDVQGSSGNQTVAPSLTISDQAVRLDVTEAVNRAQASSRRDANNNLVQTGEVLSANRIFLAYAEALIPLADMQFSSGARVLGFDLWTDSENASARRTSATIFGAGAERPAPRQNTELALRIAAHMTMNMLAWRDAEDRPKAATLLLDGSIAGNVASIQVDGVQAYPFWETGSAIANNRAALARYGLNFNNPALRPDRNDLDRDGNTGEAMARLYDPSRTNLSEAPEAVNIFAVRPEPVITHVQSFTVYTDAIRVGTGTESEVLTGRNFRSTAEVRDELESLDNQFEIADSSVDVEPPAGPLRPSDRIGNIKIDGRVRADNPDFILEMVAFQISNPTSSPIALSGIDPSTGQTLRAPQFAPEGRSGVFQADGTPINSWLDPFDVTQAASGGDAVTRESMSYYIEFGGRFYRLANYNWQPTGVNGDGTTNERNLQGQAVVLQPGESRVFYVLSQRPADISQRIRQATGQTFTSREVVSWIESHLWQRLTLRRAPGSPGFQTNEPPEVVVPVGDGQENRPVMMVAVNRETGEVIDRNSGITDALEVNGREYGVGVLYPQAPDLRSNFSGRPEVQLINQNPGSATPDVDNSTVRLWRVFRTGSEIGGDNQPQNDTLIDRLTDPIPGRDLFRSMAINASLEQRIGMGGPDSSDDRRLGSIVRVANSKASLDRTDDNTGLSVVMTGGFRRPDDPGSWVNLDDSSAPVFNYRGPGGGPVPAGFTNTFPRNAIPAWSVEVPPRASINDVVSSGSADWWTRGLPARTVRTNDPRPDPTSSTPIERGRNTNYFLIGPANVAAGSSSPASNINITDFEDDTFGISSGGSGADAARRRPFMLSRRLLGEVDALLQDEDVTRFEVQGLQVNDQREITQGTVRAAVPVVPALAAHPSEKFLQTELIRRSLRRAGASDRDVGPRRGDAITLIDYSDLDVATSGDVENVVTIRTTATGVIRPQFTEGTVRTGNADDDRSFDRQYTIVPTYPRALPSRQTNQVGEEPIVPELRPADVLLPLAFGPSNTPRPFNGGQSRSQNLAQQWVTFSEAAGAALNYTAGGTNGQWNERIGQVLDRGRLPVNRFVAFNDDRGDLTVPIAPGVTSPVRQDLDGGIPLGAAVLDKFRTRSEGSATSAVLGTINVNTATHAALMMLPMFTAADFNRGNQDIAALHSWMTHGLTQSMTSPSFTASTSSPQQDGAMNSFGAQSALAGEIDSRSFLRGRPDSVWDVASTLMAYRDKNAVLSMPSFDGSNRYMLDFAEGNLGTIATATRFDDSARQDLTGIPGLREGRGLRSLGELMALRINPGSGVTLRNPFTLANGTVVPGVDTPAEAQVSIDRFIRDNQPADYAFQRRGLQSGSNWVSLDSGSGRAFRVPLALTSMPALEQVDFGGLQPPRAVGVDTSLNLLPGAARVDPTTFANLQSDTSVDSYEQGLLIANAALNSVNVRSDIFCAYFVIHGYQQSDVEGLSQVAGEATYEQPMVPTLKRRYMVVIDRSNVTRAGQKPRILMFQELPAE
ncbi:MAG: hypothetical protein MUE97_00125 [Phycisphaerales bacterium]|jgi:hypothetical protein|nr:hypothetical protein [Phycisphaerales bacterium]